jgi:DNA-binding MarR family transcriptional regulator
LDERRSQLAHHLVATLPRFGIWATSFRDVATPWGKIGFRQVAILYQIRQHLIDANHISPSALARHNHVQASVITRALAKLEANQLITRSVHPVDTRVLRVEITARGREVSAYVERLFVEEMLDSLAFASDHDIAVVQEAAGILDRPGADLERKRRGRAPPRRARRRRRVTR